MPASRVACRAAPRTSRTYPLTPVQEGLLFHHLRDRGGGDLYVIPMVLSASSRQKLEELIAALQSVIDRHDALRTSVHWEGLRRPVQVVWREARLPVEEVTLNRDRDALEQIEERILTGTLADRPAARTCSWRWKSCRTRVTSAGSPFSRCITS